MFFLTEMSENYSILMAFVDLIPVVLFFLAGMILIKDMYNKLVKGNYALLTTGIVMVFTAGLLKAIWKMLVAANICDWVALNKSFFPMQGFGFMFYGLALVGILYSKKMMEKGQKACSFIPVFLLIPVLSEVVEFTNVMPFVVLQIIGDTIALGMLFYMALKMKNIKAMILLPISFVTMLAMGYLSSQFKSTNPVDIMNWVAEIVNTISQATLLAAIWIMHKHGLEDANIFEKKVIEE